MFGLSRLRENAVPHMPLSLFPSYLKRPSKRVAHFHPTWPGFVLSEANKGNAKEEKESLLSNTRHVSKLMFHSRN